MSPPAGCQPRVESSVPSGGSPTPTVAARPCSPTLGLEPMTPTAAAAAQAAGSTLLDIRHGPSFAATHPTGACCRFRCDQPSPSGWDGWPRTIARSSTRAPRRPLPRRLGTRTARHRRPLRPMGPQAPHQRRNAPPGRWSTPPLLASIGDIAKPNFRARAVGVHRLWRTSDSPSAPSPASSPTPSGSARPASPSPRSP